MTDSEHDIFTAAPFPHIRLPMVDGGRMGRQRHTVHGLIEFDVPETRRAIRAYRTRTGEGLSFTAFIVFCLGQAINTDKQMHAYRDWRNRVIIFDKKELVEGGHGFA